MDLRPIIAVIVGLLVLWALLIGFLWIRRPRDVAIGELVRVVPNLVRLVRDLLADNEVPAGPRIALAILLVWLVSPIDLIPEFIPVLGPLDDVVVAVIVLRYVRRRVGEAELRRRWQGTDDGFRLLSAVLGSDSSVR